MQIQLVAVGKKMPSWVEAGYYEYAKRFPKEMSLDLVEIAAGKRNKNSNIERLTHKEGEQMLAAIPKSHHVVALDVKGQSWSTAQLSQQLAQWRQLGQDVSLLIGGPEGLSPDCLSRANQSWSLSKLTLPHPLVRVVVAETLYRAWSLLNNHPYHRE